MFKSWKRSRWSLWCTVAVCFALTGCGQTLPRKKSTYPTRGTVSLNGEPLKGGKLMFTPLDTENGLDGQAKILPDGKYQAFVYVEQTGLIPGEYKVWLEQYAFQPPEVPDKYSSAEKSDKTVTISSSDNDLDVDFQTGEGETEAE